MFIDELYQTILSRQKTAPKGSYTAELFAKGLPRIAQKVGEEATEVVVATLSQENSRLVEEIADLTYHLLVLMAAKGIEPKDVMDVLSKRKK